MWLMWCVSACDYILSSSEDVCKCTAKDIISSKSLLYVGILRCISNDVVYKNREPSK